MLEPVHDRSRLGKLLGLAIDLFERVSTPQGKYQPQTFITRVGYTNISIRNYHFA